MVLKGTGFGEEGGAARLRTKRYNRIPLKSAIISFINWIRSSSAERDSYKVDVEGSTPSGSTKFSICRK